MSRFALYRKRKNMYDSHLEVFPDDVCFSLLPNDLLDQFQVHKRLKISTDYQPIPYERHINPFMSVSPSQTRFIEVDDNNENRKVDSECDDKSAFEEYENHEVSTTPFDITVNEECKNNNGEINCNIPSTEGNSCERRRKVSNKSGRSSHNNHNRFGLTTRDSNENNMNNNAINENILNQNNKKSQSFMDIQIDQLQYPVFPRPGICVKDHFLAVLSMAIKLKLRHKVTLFMLKWLNDSNINSGLPRNKNGLWEKLSRNKSVLTKHFYCGICDEYLGKSKNFKRCTSASCSSNITSDVSIHYFLQLDLRSQIKDLLALPHIRNGLKYRSERKKENPNALADIYDGQAYEDLCQPGGFLSNNYNYSFTLNTDGASVSGSSNTSAWPLFLQWNELPPHSRKRNMLLSIIWVGKGHPNMNIILQPFIDKMKKLYNVGVTWCPDGTKKVRSRFAIILCTVDSVARPLLLRMKQFNGWYGCNFCYAFGTRREGRGQPHTYPVKDGNAILRVRMRTHDDIIRDGQSSVENDAPKFGVKGLSILCLLSEFDLVNGMVVEYGPENDLSFKYLGNRLNVI